MMIQKITERLKSGRWTVETARRFLILCRNWILERGPMVAALTLTVPVMAQGYQPKGWCFYDKQDGTDAAWHLGARDKRAHCLAGFVIGSWVALAANHFGMSRTVSFWWGLAAGITAGYLKEVYDMRRGSGTGEFADVLSTSFGGFTGAAIVLPIVSVKW